MVNKLIKNGKVAVLYSPGYGAGWSTWNNKEYKEFLLFDKGLVNLVLKNKQDKVKDYIKEKFGDECICILGLDELEVEWVPEGTAFRIDEYYDGYESIEYMSEVEHFVA